MPLTDRAPHRSFHDRPAALVAAASDGLPPGREHLLAGTPAYLDGCRAAKRAGMAG